MEKWRLALCRGWQDQSFLCLMLLRNFPVSCKEELTQVFKSDLLLSLGSSYATWKKCLYMIFCTLLRSVRTASTLQYHSPWLGTPYPLSHLLFFSVLSSLALPSTFSPHLQLCHTFSATYLPMLTVPPSLYLSRKI